jgi:hypothetical protein
MKIEDITPAQPVVKRKSGAYNRPVRLVRRQRAEGGTVFKKERYIADIPDVNVVNYSVRIIEMKPVVKVIGVRGNNRYQ